MPEFMPGLELSRLFFEEAVRPLLQSGFPNLHYAAALIGPGSEVLGFDTEMSTDHHWGPRVMLFLSEQDLDAKTAIADRLSAALPHSIRTWPTSFTPPLAGQVTQLLESKKEGPVNHRVEISTLSGYLMEYAGISLYTGVPSGAERADNRASLHSLRLRAAEWLVVPQQKLRSLTAGAVFHDDDEVGLASVREQLSWFPRDVWLYLMASGWMRIEQEGHLMGRAGIVGDELGAALIGSRLVRDIMRLCFLIERQYAPYPKWFGTAFAQLKCAARMKADLVESLRADKWQSRQEALSRSYETLAAMQVDLLRSSVEPAPPAAQIADLPLKPLPFFDRPFLVISTGQFSEALKSAIVDPEVKSIASRRLIGSIDLFSDSTDLAEGNWGGILKGLFA